MSKLLLSWIAYNNDYLKTPDEKFQAVSEQGPHCQFYLHFYDSGQYDKHLLLYASPKQELWAEHLANRLRRIKPKAVIEIKLLDIKRVISLDEIKPKVEALLLEHREHEMDIFFSPGTSIMQLSWFICHQSLGLNTRLLQTSRASHNADNKPLLEELTFERSQTPIAATIKQFHATKAKTDSHFKLTPSIDPVYKRAAQVAQTDRVTVLIRGESGTGKEHLARHVHQESARRDAPFLAVNCSAISESLLEPRLFGHKKGAFTGAEKDSTGIFEQADGGTIFLDEIGDISPKMQQSLLRVLQEREIQPIGGKPKKVDVRVVAATNAPLEKMCKDGLFRWDLYYRLAVAELELPALCDRGTTELKTFLDHFINVKRQEFNKPKALRFTKEAMAAVLAYTFPGNVRELENMVESLYVFCEEDVALHDLPKRLRQSDPDHSMLLEDVERAHILKIYELKNKNLTHTHETLGVAKNTLKTKLKKYGVIKEE